MATTKKKFFARIADWFRGMKSELKKVVWPSWKQIVNNSAVVLAAIVACSIILWAFDWLASGFVQLLISLFG